MQPRASHDELTADETLDCTGLLCPLPVYKAGLVLQKMKPGQVLELVCTDPGSLEDVPALARQTGHNLLAAEDRGETQLFWLQKGKTA